MRRRKGRKGERGKKREKRKGRGKRKGNLGTENVFGFLCLFCFILLLLPHDESKPRVQQKTKNREGTFGGKTHPIIMGFMLNI